MVRCGDPAFPMDPCSTTYQHQTRHMREYDTTHQSYSITSHRIASHDTEYRNMSYAQSHRIAWYIPSHSVTSHQLHHHTSILIASHGMMLHTSSPQNGATCHRYDTCDALRLHSVMMHVSCARGGSASKWRQSEERVARVEGRRRVCIMWSIGSTCCMHHV